MEDIFITVETNQEELKNMSINLRYIESIVEIDDKNCKIFLHQSSTTNYVNIKCSKKDLEKKILDTKIRFMNKLIDAYYLR